MPDLKDSAMSAIEFALQTDDGLEFLRCWLHGEFDVIREEWPEAPESVFVGADPLHQQDPVTPGNTSLNVLQGVVEDKAQHDSDGNKQGRVQINIGTIEKNAGRDFILNSK